MSFKGLLPPEEWDFRSLRVEELRICQFYEFARESPTIRGIYEQFQADPTKFEVTRLPLALDRLAFMPGPHLLEVDEAHHCLALFTGTTFLRIQNEPGWKYDKAMLKTLAKIARCELVPLKSTANDGSGRSAPILAFYGEVRQFIGKERLWVPIFDLHLWWRRLAHYDGTDENVIQLEKRLDALTSAYRTLLCRL